MNVVESTSARLLALIRRSPDVDENQTPPRVRVVMNERKPRPRKVSVQVCERCKGRSRWLVVIRCPSCCGTGVATDRVELVPARPMPVARTARRRVQ